MPFQPPTLCSVSAGQQQVESTTEQKNLLDLSVSSPLKELFPPGWSASQSSGSTHLARLLQAENGDEFSQGLSQYMDQIEEEERKNKQETAKRDLQKQSQLQKQQKLMDKSLDQTIKVKEKPKKFELQDFEKVNKKPTHQGLQGINGGQRKKSGHSKGETVSRNKDNSKEMKNTKIPRVSPRNLKRKQTKTSVTLVNRLKAIRSLGIWVECVKPECQKWRFLPHVNDPCQIPEHWTCSMNPDKEFNKCSIPEKDIPEEERASCIECEYTVGSVVWAKLPGFPWWPALIDDDPDTKAYFWTDPGSDKASFYHVIFFNRLGKCISRSWISLSNLKRFTPKIHREIKKLNNCYSGQIMSWLSVAKYKATMSTKLDIAERKNKFCHLFQFDSQWGFPWELNLTGAETFAAELMNAKKEEIDTSIVKDEPTD